MRFEARELSPWADHVVPSDLVEGNIYFRVRFLDRDMMVPTLEAMVFVGRELHSSGAGLYFQDAVSHLQGYRFPLADTDPFPMAPETNSVIFETEDAWLEIERVTESCCAQRYEDALNVLLGCSLRRARWDGIARAIPQE